MIFVISVDIRVGYIFAGDTLYTVQECVQLTSYKSGGTEMFNSKKIPGEFEVFKTSLTRSN